MSKCMKIYIAVDYHDFEPPYYMAFCTTPDKAWQIIADYRAEFKKDDGKHNFNVIEQEVIE